MTTTAPTPAAVSPRTAAAALDIEESTIRQAIHTGALPAAKIGNRVRIGKADLAAWFAEHLLKQQEAERPTAGTEVEHLQGCGCEDREGGPALMYDERTVIRSGLMVAILNELEKRLRAAGRPVLQYRRERWNAAGDHIGPELAIRSCETEIVWQVAQETRELLDRLVGEMLA